MASRLLTLDASRSEVVIACRCGYRSVRGTRSEAQADADRHRAAVHPRQVTYMESKRRSRSRALTA